MYFTFSKAGSMPQGHSEESRMGKCRGYATIGQRSRIRWRLLKSCHVDRPCRLEPLRMLGYPLVRKFYSALATNAPCVPRKVTLDGHVPSRRALWLLRREHPCWRHVEVRTCKYLNNIVEQDHRAIKRRCASMAGFKSFANAAITLAGIELAHRIRKGQFSFGRGRRRRGWSRKAEWVMALG